MILYPPRQFDVNEWFIIAFIVVQGVVLYLLPKKFPASITVMLLLLGLTQAKTSDFIFNKLFELYYFNDYEKFEWFDILLSAVYPPFSYYLIYIYERWKFRGTSLFIYILLFGLFSTGLEYLILLTNVLHYSGWSLFYSFPIYLVVLSGTLLAYRSFSAVWERSRRPIRSK